MNSDEVQRQQIAIIVEQKREELRKLEEWLRSLGGCSCENPEQPCDECPVEVVVDPPVEAQVVTPAKKVPAEAPVEEPKAEEPKEKPAPKKRRTPKKKA